jgi:hypothetical protein
MMEWEVGAGVVTTAVYLCCTSHRRTSTSSITCFSCVAAIVSICALKVNIYLVSQSLCT